MQHQEHIQKLKKSHTPYHHFTFDKVKLHRGYSNRILRIDLSKNETTILPVTQEMKDLFVGGKGFDMWLTFQEINKDTKWDSDNNPICFYVGPLGGTTSFPGAGKTIVTAISPATASIMDSNVGGYFGPYLKFAGFDAMVIVGKAKADSIIYIDAVKGSLSIETAPLEKLDSHIIAEDLTDMYAEDDLDKRNISVVSAGSASEHSRMGLLNFSFFDWRRNVARFKQAGRGGIGTVFRDKKLKAILIKNNGITPAWTIAESKVAKNTRPKKIFETTCKNEISKIDSIITKWNSNPDYLVEIMHHLMSEYKYISKTSIDRLNFHLKIPKSYIYQVATFYDTFSLEPKGEKTIQVCMGPGCHAKGAQIVLDTFKKELGIKEGETTPCQKYTLLASNCLGACDKAPLVKINDQIYGKVNPTDVKLILSGDFSNDSSLDSPEIIQMPDHTPVCACGGDKNFSTFKKLLKENNAQKIIDVLTESKLKGRGGAGFLTGKKMQAVFDSHLGKKLASVIVVNSAIFELDPLNVIEGILISALAVGADTGFICFRNEHLNALLKMNDAIKWAQTKNFLGKNICGSHFSFDLQVRHGAGSFVIGESSALLQTLVGRVGEPRAKYIKLAETGFKKRPTLVCNIETMANIPQIIEKGASWFTSIGKHSTGTKLLSISGDVKNPSFVEVPFGTTINEVIQNACGGVSNPKKRSLKFVQVGGPTGGYLPASMLEQKIDYDSLTEVGAIIGSGLISVKNDRKCLIDSLLYQINFLASESCGKCTPCREGLSKAKSILQNIAKGKGSQSELSLLEDIATTMQETSLCQFGKTASNPILSALRYFKEDFISHMDHKICASGVCKDLTKFHINDKCTGCTLCAKVCPTGCITSKKKELHIIDQQKCIKCGACYDVCNFKSVEVR